MAMTAIKKVRAMERRFGVKHPRTKKGARHGHERVVRKPKTDRFLDFIRAVKPRYQFYPHCLKLIHELQKVADGENKRLMVFMPPRSGKSELVSRLFPAYMVHRFPEKFVGLSSYGADLAQGFSRNARDYFLDAGGTPKVDASSIRFWLTNEGGGMWAAGVGGPITGRGFDLGIIDDPIKDAEEAQSITIRAKHKHWYDSTWDTREEAGAAQIVTLTRWHQDDLAGYLLEAEQESPQYWRILFMEGIKTDDEVKLPSTCTLVKDDRVAGEALCEARVSMAKMLTQKKRNPFWFSALYQQRPSPPEGNLWKREWFADHVFDVLPDGTFGDGYDWDTAYTEKEQNSASAYIRSCRDRQGNIYITELGFRWLEFPDLVNWMKLLEGPHFIEAKAAGKSSKQALRRDGITAVEVAVQGGADKVARTVDVTPLAMAGQVRVRRALLSVLLDDDKQGILVFPNGTHDDVNDAFTQALSRQSKLELPGGAMSGDRSASDIHQDDPLLSIR